MELLILSLAGLGLIFWLSRKKKSAPTSTSQSGIINIIVENGAANKTKTTERNTIIKEAETLFFSLQKKYLYSPVPFKVLGDFYVQKGLPDKALEKYSQMILYLNTDLSIEKLADALVFMRAEGADAEAETIETYYRSKGDN
jgi:hypothetical protein